MSLESKNGKWVESSKKKPFTYQGIPVDFAELDGPFTKEPGGFGDFEQGEYVIVYFDGELEVGCSSFPSYKKAHKALKKLEKRGVAVSSLTSN